MKSMIRYVLLTAVRDRLFIGLCAAIALIYGLAIFTGSTALSEQASMSLVLFAGASRVVLVIGLIVFACFHVQRAFDYREIESILAKPISRTVFVAGYASGFSLLSIMMLIPVLLILLTFPGLHMAGLIWWAISAVLEIAMVVIFALLAALVLQNAFNAVLASTGFYIIARLMGFFMIAINSPTSMMGEEKWGHALLFALKMLSTVIPRLDMFAKSEWLLYGVVNAMDVWLFLAQALVFTFLLLAMAIFDLKRKQF